MLSSNPTRQSNIFIPDYWTSTNGLSKADMNELFLQFPQGQGNETIPNLISSTANLGTVAAASIISNTITATFVGNITNQTTTLLQTDINIPPKLALIKQTINYPVNSVTTITPSKINANLPNNAYTKYSQIFTYGKSIPPVIVAAGAGTNTLAYSTDNSLTWTGIGTSIFSSVGYCASWNGSIWLAGGDNGTQNSIAYSYNGMNWTVVNTVVLSTVRGISWNGSLWVAVGQPQTHSIAYSYDGINWIGAYTGFSTALSVAWNGNLFVATGLGPNTMAYSYDGITWTGLGLIFPDVGYCIAWDGTKFIAGGDGNPNTTLKYSYDGISGWTSIPNLIPFFVLGIEWNGILWVAVGYNNPTIEYSYDGFNWVSAGNPFGGYGQSVNWTGTIFNAAGIGATNMLSSADGINWKSSTSPFSTSAQGSFSNTIRSNTIKFPSNISIALGAGTTNTLAYSTDNGLTFTGLGKLVFNSSARGAAWNGSIWVACGSSTNTLAYSYDGINWVGNGRTIFTFTGVSVVWNGTIFIASGQGSNILAYSTDGISWTGLGLLTSVFSTSVFCVAWDGTKFIAGGNGGRMGYSYNGTTWFSITNPFTGNILGIVWSGFIWVAVGEVTTTVAYSIDGFTWTGLGTTVFGTQGRGVSWNGSTFVAVGVSTDQIAYSYDGIAWTSIDVSSIFSSATLNGIGWNGTRWTALASGGANTIAYSRDGKEWTGLGTGIFSTAGWNVAWNKGIPSISGNITLQNPVTSLDVVAPSYYNNQNNVSITIKAQPN